MHYRLFFRLAASFFFVLLFSSSVSGEAPVSETDVSARQPASSEHAHEPISWVLRGLENNFGLEIDRSALLSSQDRVEVTLGDFVTRFVSQARFSRSERRQNRLEFNQSGQVADIFDEDVLQLRVGLEQQLTTGGRVSISNVSSRTVNPTTRRGLELS